MGLFVVFEGPEGSGKTTQIRLLQQDLLRAGREVLATREPGGTLIGDQIRQILHAVENTSMLPITEALLYSAARAQHVGEVIRPALARDEFVISDRYAYSTLAYQGDGHGLDKAMLRQMTLWATEGLEPDLVVYLDLDVSEGLQRKQQASRDEGGEWNRMDQLDVGFHRLVREGYLRMAREDPARWLVVDASRPAEAISCQIRSRIDELCERCGFLVQGG
jgi:dTMP kinase